MYTYASPFFSLSYQKVILTFCYRGFTGYFDAPGADVASLRSSWQNLGQLPFVTLVFCTIEKLKEMKVCGPHNLLIISSLQSIAIMHTSSAQSQQWICLIKLCVWCVQLVVTVPTKFSQQEFHVTLLEE